MSDDYDLYGGVPPHVAGCDTSLEAALEALPNIETLRGKVLELITRAGNATCAEVEQQLHLCHQSASARIRELVLKKHVRDSGQRRLTCYKRKAIVWELNKGEQNGQA